MAAVVTYRPFTAADVEGVRRVALAAWRETYGGGLLPEETVVQWVDEGYPRQELLDLLPSVASAESCFAVAEERGEVVGFCQAAVGPDGPQLSQVFLDPRSVRRGIGRALVERAEDFLRSRGATRYFCRVWASNDAAIAFFVALGFVHVPERDPTDWHGRYFEKALAD